MKTSILVLSNFLNALMLTLIMFMVHPEMFGHLYDFLNALDADWGAQYLDFFNWLKQQGM